MKVYNFTVLPSLPPELTPLLEIAYNLWFAWNWEAAELFKTLDSECWKAVDHNPVRMLSIVSPERLSKAARNTQFVANVNLVRSRLQSYLKEETYYEKKFGKPKHPIAYFSCEFGIHESLPIYSGGLGILAGDHLKSASDLGVPIIGIGLLYRHGYFTQKLNPDGVQEELYPENDGFGIPLQLVNNKEGTPLVLSVMMGLDEVFFQVWKANVGRTSLYLMDTNIPSNSPHHQEITARLYDSGRDTRLRQEMLLGIGGTRALKAMGIQPGAFHCNEGHSAFLTFERMRLLMTEQGLTFDEAREVVWASTVFTTHTPVPAGHEHFDSDLMKKYFDGYNQQLGLTWKEFLALGQPDGAKDTDEFSMTMLAIRMAAHINGVSKFHGAVSRKMWQHLFPEVPEHEVPISSITNGIHSTSWIHPPLFTLLSGYSEGDPSGSMACLTLWENIDKVGDTEFWEAHVSARRRLVHYVRERLKKQNAGQVLKSNEVVLDPNILTIGFARRFAAYKRASLLLKDPDRLIKLLCDSKKPVQFIFAGKAHPNDGIGKDIIKSLVKFASRPEVCNRIIFLEGYDINMARHFVWGADVWLNTPRRPLEASGTSGMKAAVNGVLNLSILDGWWDEAFVPEVGWAIGSGEAYSNPDLQDKVDAEHLFGLLEDEIVPMYYERDSNGLPREWIQKMKNSIKILGPQYNTHRMVLDYNDHYYEIAGKFYENLSSNGFQKAKNLASWRKNLIQKWSRIEVVSLERPTSHLLATGEEFSVKAALKLEDFPLDNLTVELFLGALGSHNQLEQGGRVPMEVVGNDGPLTVFKASVRCQKGGRYGYSVSVRPNHPDLAAKFLPGLIKWYG